MILLLLFIPLIAAAAVWLVGNKLASRIALIGSVFQLILTFVVYLQYKNNEVFYFFQEWIATPKISFHLAADGLSIAMLLLTNFLVPLIILSGFNREINNARSYFALILGMQFALVGVFLAMDGLLYYIFWELALIPVYFIALIWGGADRVKVTLKFFIYTLAGSLFMLLGFIALYWYNPGQSFDIRELYRLSEVVSPEVQSWLFWAFFIAFAIKIPIVPFHTWQADTYQQAPTQATMLLSGIMLKMATYSLMRWLLPILPEGVAQWGPFALGLCVFGIVYASIIAIMQKDLKRLFAYSSVAHVGLISAGIFTLTTVGLQGSVVQMLAHGVNVVGLFLCADIILNRTKTNDIASLGGIRSVAPKFNTLFLIVVLASIALPLTNGFIGEFMLLFGIYTYNIWAAVFAGLTIILGAVYMLRMFQNTMLGETKASTKVFEDLKWNEWAVLGIIAVVIFVMGLYPKIILDLTAPSIDAILNQAIIK
ncbi:MAG: NADH-quinone oxidoreductase subunit M [Cyclobacteriaceae bacterium]|nr:NADH-quinone oxidoreductase subunit M [Cyclobacteriaceae bacterium]MCH8515263.1 NADH-quinone oxidoreductase subunit M [Cyclobacteriaceae bacterium]